MYNRRRKRRYYEQEDEVFSLNPETDELIPVRAISYSSNFEKIYDDKITISGKTYKNIKAFCKKQGLAFSYVKKHAEKNNLNIVDAATSLAYRLHGGL